MRTYITLVVAALFAASCQSGAPASTPAPIARGSAPAPAVAPATPPTPGSAAADPWLEDKPIVKDPLPHPLLWSATKDGKTTYFLGTIHTGVDAERRLPDRVWAKLDDASAFAMEADVSKLDVASLVRTDHHTLHEELGADYWAKFSALVTPRVAANIDRMKPMVAASLLEMQLLPGTPAMDGTLQAHAINRKKEVVFLEAIETQQQILEKFLTAKALKMMIDRHATLAEEIHHLLDAYVAGDADALVALADRERVEEKAAGLTDAELDAQTEALLYGRNASWIPVLEKLHQRDHAFVAVGVAHLTGKRSVLELLAQRGYTITRIE